MSSNLSDGIELTGYEPGCFSTLCAMQSAYYARDWGFHQIYESVVAAGVAEFLTRYHPDNDFVRLVKNNGKIVGGIVIDSRNGTADKDKAAQLRWFILSDELRGLGIGKKIIVEAMDFVREKSLPCVFLMTFSGLDSARRLYEQMGFTLIEEKTANTWGREVKEQRFEWIKS